MAGFGRNGAVEALSEIAPNTSLIAIHDRPSEIMRAHAHAHARLAAVLPRPVRIKDFMYAVACALKEPAMADPA